MFSYAGKRAVITGAGRGIGRAIALAFAAQGADLTLAARSEDELEAVAAEIRGMGQRAWVMPADMNRLEEAERLIETATREMGGLDILINNAGGGSSVPGGLGPLDGITPEGFDAVFNLNLRTPAFAALRAAARSSISSRSTDFSPRRQRASTARRRRR